MEESNVHVLDYLQVLRRRKWWLIAPVVLSVLVGGILLKVLPKEYESNVTITVAAPAVATNYLNTGQLGTEERLRALTQQLVSTLLLTKVAEGAGISAPKAETPEQSQELLMSQMRLAIAVSLPKQAIVNPNEPGRLDAFVITYKDSDPGRARSVADLLATEFIAENTKARAERAEGTSAFIAQQLKESQTRLTQYETQLRDVKEVHMGQLPEQMEANLSTLTGLRTQLDSNATALRSAEDRLSMVERTVESMAKAGRDAEAANHTHPLDPDSAAARLQQLERDLAKARIAYTPKHPEVQRLEIDVRDARLAAAAERRLNPQEHGSAWEQDPTYRQAVADRETSRLRIRDLQRSGSDIQRQIAQYQLRVESAPRVEQQLAAMVRDYELEKQQYAELSSKLHAATISESVERTGAGEQFSLLYPATLPNVPKSPVPLRVMLLSIAAGFVLGAGATLGREYFDRSVRDVRDLKAEFELPVLGKVARIHPR